MRYVGRFKRRVLSLIQKKANEHPDQDSETVDKIIDLWFEVYNLPEERYVQVCENRCGISNNE